MLAITVQMIQELETNYWIWKMTRIDHIALVVDEPKLAAKWYEFNFNAEILYLMRHGPSLSLRTLKWLLSKKAMHPVHFAFEVDNFDDIEGKVKTHRDGSRSVYKSDPWGNIYELINYEYEE
jgi:catechol-2,3-dioxygenase